MSRSKERPTRTAELPPSPWQYRESHPAYAMVGAYRVESTPAVHLFGSDFRHRAYVAIRIKAGELRRGLHHDWHGSAAGGPYIEVALSEAHWATFVSAMNIGEGVPATLTWLRDVGDLPGISPWPDHDRRQQLHDEVDATLAETIKRIQAVIDSGKVPAALRKELEQAVRDLDDGLPFVAKSFDEHAEGTVEKMKIEVAAYISDRIQRAGLAALAGQPLLELGEPEEVPSGG